MEIDIYIYVQIFCLIKNTTLTLMLQVYRIDSTKEDFSEAFNETVSKHTE